ncbi:hypothetical protein CEXT_36921 [Caerostris extrusa]|uniref:Uncharacterized protein n=1 Tax=Caerostris extrusa TaxID=172846 RepID=A0AAV4VWG9_CAEEX|nr:hypothetical protein CEXT_36921 [Caerostris extrusa]
MGRCVRCSSPVCAYTTSSVGIEHQSERARKCWYRNKTCISQHLLQQFWFQGSGNSGLTNSSHCCGFPLPGSGSVQRCHLLLVFRIATTGLTEIKQSYENAVNGCGHVCAGYSLCADVWVRSVPTYYESSFEGLHPSVMFRSYVTVNIGRAQESKDASDIKERARRSYTPYHPTSKETQGILSFILASKVAQESYPLS